VDRREASAVEEGEYLATLARLHRAHWPTDLPTEPQYRFGEVPLTEYLREWARLQGEKPAVIFYGARLTYGELDGLSDRFAALLQARGIGKGDRVAVFCRTARNSLSCSMAS
jgi:fatty-acyl-CoA synthase